MTCSRNFKILLGTTALAGAVWSALPAFADEQIETVVVTARQRSENIEKFPGQVTAFTAGAIEAKGIQSPKDFLNAVPNVTFIPTQNAGTSFVVIRGISQSRNSEPSVAVVVDGVPMTQPAEFNQDLFDIQQIEVVKGPQGALYGRDAIGGAIIINTKQPTDDWEGRVTAGYDDGPGGKVQGVISGPITDQLKFRASASYLDTDGWLTNIDTKDQSARRDADPAKDFNGRLSFLYTPTNDFTVDLRLSTDLLNTRGLYYVVPPFGSPHFNDPNFTSQPIDMNNSGIDDRKIYDASLKLTDNVGDGTLSSITGYSTVWEILTGDGYPFNPFGQSAVGFDYGQAQFLDVKTFSQEVRYTSSSSDRFRWITGGEIFYTQRYISTGNMYDGTTDSGVQPVYRDPNPQFGIDSFAPQSQVSFLADGQNQFAWAGYIDTSYDIFDNLELSANLRYDNDHRENITLTPQEFLDANPITGRQAIPAVTGEKRSHTWSAFQPQAILRWQATDEINLYADYSRGFRSGGFNQTGVAQAAQASGFPNVGDLFDAEIADTYEVGVKSHWLDDRLLLNGSAFLTYDNPYYFVFLASNSTQNLGNIQKVQLAGWDLDMTGRLDENLSVNGGFGYISSVVKEFPGALSALVVGHRAPLVSDYTANIGVQYDRDLGEGFSFHSRLDYNRIGDTTFVIPVLAEPNPIARRPVDLVDLRIGFEKDSWSATFWSKNLFDKQYNTEYSTGGFLFKADGRQLGIDLTKRF
ncbi:MAG TPA: TonB-dependent receptor [Rhizomicrobium sp.]|jgi:iron complex outermembrane receptor protein|nr:TonB-dependent receptor [Rhizomicrobium sp.]